MLTYLLQGAILGFVAGVSPGPLLGLLINKTVRWGWRAGVVVALSPLLTDIPLILLFVFLLDHLPALVLHIFTLVGGLFVVYLGYETVRKAAREVQLEVKERPGSILLTALVTNIFNPHPFIFWATVGSPLLLNSFAAAGMGATGGFLVCFYALLLCAKLSFVFLVNWGRAWLKGSGYRCQSAGSGILMLGLGLALLWEGVSALL
ncbi:LysE family translocator [Ktedonosporobacter rubrisoli]|uniref:LysE family translocator n=1 Tax=Ktedonosporobacter rubrisoli TaxID=2509675 RepID=A0A4P6JZL1_KTERU|nr:LysE family transporter [Ktedonosporobacter rubrisoli]QBD80933.1 LysE family translocator [Ktedonosporobacter rubrisoli]